MSLDLFSSPITVAGEDLPKGRLSPSQVNMYLRCPQQWYFRYVKGEKAPPDGGLTQGKALHLVAETDLLHKMKTGEDMPEDTIPELAGDSFDWASKEAEFKPGEDPGKLKDETVRMSTFWHATVAPEVKPEAVEHTFKATLGGYEVMGIIDVEEAERVRDWKTAARKPSGEVGQLLQAQTYHVATEKPVKYTYLVKNKQISLHEPEAKFPANTREVVEQVYHQVGRAMEAGIVYRKTDGWHCSPRFCGFYDQCLGKNGVRRSGA